MRLAPFVLLALCATPLAACTSIGAGSTGAIVGPGSTGTDIQPGGGSSNVPICKPNEELVTLGGVLKCV